MDNSKLKTRLIGMPTCLALLVGLSACTISEPTIDRSSTPITSQVIESNQKTSIFTYYVDPVNQAQPMAIVRGRFLWKDGCIYLVDNANEYTTAMFPSLPKGVFKWDEATKTLNLGNHIFKMGDYIVTNGGSKPYLPNTESAAILEKQGDKKCLTSSLTMIGTFSIPMAS